MLGWSYAIKHRSRMMITTLRQMILLPFLASLPRLLCLIAFISVSSLVALWHAPALHADGGAPNLAYVAGAGPASDNLAIIDITQHRSVGSVAIGGRPAGVVLSTDGRYAYVTESTANELAIIDANAHKVAATIPVGATPTALALDLSQTPNLLYVANSGSSSVMVIDPNAQQVQATISVGLHPTGIAVALPGTGIGETDPNDAEVYVANSNSDTVSVISTKHRHVIATISAPGGPLGVAIPQTGGIAYVSTRAGTVLALSLATHQLLGVLLRSDAGPLGTMDYDAVTGQVYVPDPAANVVYVLAPAAITASGSLAVPKEPTHILSITGGPIAVAITFEGSYGFVAQRQSGQVTILDAATHQIQATISVGGMPDAIVTGAYPPSVSSQSALLFNLLVGGAIIALMVFALIAGTRRPKGLRKAGDGAAAQRGGLDGE